MDMSNSIRIACYNSADGPRLMLFGPMNADFLSLQRIFKSLSKNNPQDVLLEKKEFVRAFGNIRLLMICGGLSTGSNPGYMGQGIRKTSSNPPAFTWNRTSEGWDYLAELIEGVVKSNIPCHQYLTRYPDEDVIVVVSKGEYTDDVVS